MKTVIIIGGSGFIGTGIIQRLLDRRYMIINIDRVPSSMQDARIQNKTIDTSNDTFDPAWFEGVYGVINLVGVPIFGRWTQSYRQSIYDSRIKTTDQIGTVWQQVQVVPRVLVNASAVGYYGECHDQQWRKEIDTVGTDFLARVCQDWELSAGKVAERGTRVVLVRTGHVIGKGGLLGVLLPLFRHWMGGYFGNGSQGMPWIDWRDVIDWYVYALEHDQVVGAYNTNVDSVSQRSLMQMIQKISGQPILWRIPAIAVWVLYFGFAKTLTTGVYADNKKILATGFEFRHTDLEQSLRDAWN